MSQSAPAPKDQSGIERMPKDFDNKDFDYKDFDKEPAREAASVVDLKDMRHGEANSAAILPPPQRTRRGRGALRAILMLGGIALVLAGAGYSYLGGGRFVSTDNSYVRAAKLMVSTDVSGIVASVAVRQGQEVQAGQELFHLDPKQFEIAVAVAQAQLDQARLTIEAARKDYERLRNDIVTQESVVAQASAAFERADALARRNVGSQAVFDQTRFTLSAEESKFKSLQQAAQVALTRLGGDAARPIEQHPQYLEAQARLAEAQRQLARTVIRAPFAGAVTAVEALQPGTFLVSSTAALTNTGAVGLIGRDNIWIEANMKETDLTHVRPGNAVEIAVDAYPNRIWKGRVESIFPSTASEFSILPAQNAGGNWVKVVQRIAVRIAVERGAEDPVLRPGMSTVVTIDTGHKRTLNDLWTLVGLGRPAGGAEPVSTAAQGSSAMGSSSHGSSAP